MRKTIVSTGDENVPTVFPGWGDVGPVTALGLAQAQLEAVKVELQDTQEKLREALRVAAATAVELDYMKAILLERS